MAPVIYLASRSPRRHELLLQIGVPHRILDIEVDESVRAGESASEYVLRISQDKAEAGLKSPDRGENLPVLAADTCVVVDGRMLGKPADAEEGRWMLRQLSGRTHEVHTAVSLNGQRLESRVSHSRVSFRPLSALEIEDYWRSGEPADKAGGYGIQGLAAMFINDLSGSYSGVMGLPLFETAELLGGAGIEILNTNKNKLK